MLIHDTLQLSTIPVDLQSRVKPGGIVAVTSSGVEYSDPSSTAQAFPLVPVSATISGHAMALATEKDASIRLFGYEPKGQLKSGSGLRFDQFEIKGTSLTDTQMDVLVRDGYTQSKVKSWQTQPGVDTYLIESVYSTTEVNVYSHNSSQKVLTTMTLAGCTTEVTNPVAPGAPNHPSGPQDSSGIAADNGDIFVTGYDDAATSKGVPWGAGAQACRGQNGEVHLLTKNPIPVAMKVVLLKNFREWDDVKKEWSPWHLDYIATAQLSK